MDEKPIEAMSDALIGGYLTDPLDVQAWVQPMSQQDSMLHEQDLSSPPQFQFDELQKQQQEEDELNHQHVQLQLQLQQEYHQQQNTQASQMKLAEDLKSSHYDKCIVCARVFKNPNSLEKHLRNVHTAHIIRPELTTSIKKSSEYRRIVLNKKPIKENVAKALVSKLNKKNQQHIEQQQIAAAAVSEQLAQNAAAIAASVNESAWNGNSLAPISSSSDKTAHIENGNTIIIISNVELNPANTSNGYTFANYQAALPKLVPISSGLKTQVTTLSAAQIPTATHTHSTTTTTATFDLSPKHENNNNNEVTSLAATTTSSPTADNFSTSPKVFIIDKSNGENSKSHHKMPKIQSSDDSNEQHQCPECEKVFLKKYQLKRHQEIHENLFYFCPFCKRAPVKARSSLRKHFIKDHPEHQDTWQASNFFSTLLKKHEKIKKSSHESHDSTKKNNKKESKKESKKKKEKLIIESINEIETSSIDNCSSSTTINNNHHHNHHYHHNSHNHNQHSHQIINDQPLPQVSIETDADDAHQQQQIILSNLFLDPITLDEENNLIKYTLAGEDDFMNGHNGESSSVVNMTHAGSIESYEMSEFSNFKSSFDEIQEKLDAELEFNNDQMIKWSDELDDSSSVLSSQSTSNLSASDIGKTLGKPKNGFMLT